MWQKELSTARKAAGRAGGILAGRAGKAVAVTKKGEIDLRTEADMESQQAVLKILSTEFPRDSILAEESDKQRQGDSGRTWVVDPLDGTTNFAHGFPFFAVSIALEAEGRPVVGVVLNPESGEEFTAVRGGGAFLNNHPIRVSSTSGLGDALLATGFPYDICERPDEVLSLFRRMIVRARGVRRAGSAALDLCFLAAGRFDGFWEQSLKPWDTAAGVLIAEEAGAVATTYQGGEYTPYHKTICAANPALHPRMVEVLSLREDEA
ncbi:MAG: inositol monophosphatase family protein [Desulfobacteraceae bacterium]